MRVLIIDDEEDTRSIFSMSLGLLGGIDVIEAPSGAEGIEKAANENPDVIILDLLMPEMDGTQTFLCLKGRPDTEKIPVIFMTVKGMFSEFEAMKSLGALAVIAKPFDPTTLTQMIKSILDANGYQHITGNGDALSESQAPATVDVPRNGDSPPGLGIPQNGDMKNVGSHSDHSPDQTASPPSSVKQTAGRNGDSRGDHSKKTAAAGPGSSRVAGSSTASGAAKKAGEIARKAPISAAQRYLAAKKAKGKNSKKTDGKSVW